MADFRKNPSIDLVGATKAGSSIIAAIDIGTNSVHLVVAQVDSAGHMKILDMDKVAVRLGQSINASGAISLDGIKKTVLAVEHMVEIASGYDCTIRAIATHATREATNHHDLIDAVFKKTKIKIEVIDGIEEARLIYLGMRNGMHIDSQTCLGMDIGGGSTEIIIARGDDVKFVTSLKLGAVTLTSKCFKGKAPNAKSIAKIHSEIDLKLGPLLQYARHLKFTKALASSGTAKALLMLNNTAKKGRDVSDGNGLTFSRRQLDISCSRLELLKNPTKIVEVLKVDPSRSDILIAGAAIMQAVTRAFHVEEWTYSSFGLREGIVIDTWRRSQGEGRRHSPKIRHQSVYDLGKRAEVDEKQARAVADMSMQLFDQLMPRIYTSLTRDEFGYMRNLLYAASWLHEVGRFVSISAFHRHSQYLIGNTRLMGFTQDERTIISLIVRYHRKSPPPVKVPSGSDLTKSEWDSVKVLAGILRLTTSLSRSRRNRVKSIKLRMVKGAMKLSLGVARGNVIDVEILKARLELPIVESAWEWPIRLEH